MNQKLLESLGNDLKKRFDHYLSKVLTASAEYGEFGLPLLDTLHNQLGKTSCDNCGACCNSVSIYSLEYHRIVRDLLTRLPPRKIRDLFRNIFFPDQRLAEVGSENRLRCPLRDDITRICLVHSVRPFACRFFGMAKENAEIECSRVIQPHGTQPLSEQEMVHLQSRIMEMSESYEVFPGKPTIAFFPFEFWAFRFTLGVEKALEIYREILIPASTPLTRLWAGKIENNQGKGELE